TTLREAMTPGRADEETFTGASPSATVAISVSFIGLPFNSIAVKLNVERSISNVQRSTRILAMVTDLRHRKREKPGRARPGLLGEIAQLKVRVLYLFPHRCWSWCDDLLVLRTRSKSQSGDQNGHDH